MKKREEINGHVTADFGGEKKQKAGYLACFDWMIPAQIQKEWDWN